MCIRDRAHQDARVLEMLPAGQPSPVPSSSPWEGSARSSSDSNKPGMVGNHTQLLKVGKGELTDMIYSRLLCTKFCTPVIREREKIGPLILKRLKT